MTHPNGFIKTYPLERLTRLYDGIEQLEEDLYDQEGPEQDELAGDEVWMEDGVWHPTTLDSEDGWVDEEEEDMVSDIETTSNSNGAVDMDTMEIDIATGWGKPGVLDPSLPILSSSPPFTSPSWNELTDEAAVKTVNSRETMSHMTSTSTTSLSPLPGPIQILGENATSLGTPIIPMTNSPSGSSLLSKDYIYKDQTRHTTNGDSSLGAETRTDPVTETMKTETNAELTWKRFDILPCAPVDHAFYSSSPAQPAKSFLNRLNREYRALANSLPGMQPST